MQPHYIPSTPSNEYFAGYFDGEGCITMRARHPRSYRLTIGVTTGCLSVIEKLQASFGGRISPKNWKDRRPIRTNRQLYEWKLDGLQACYAFLQAIQPYAIEKRPQIDVALAWLEHRLAFPVHAFVHEFDRELARSTFDALKALKRPSD